jgi:hypothetical protein
MATDATPANEEPVIQQNLNKAGRDFGLEPVMNFEP